MFMEPAEFQKMLSKNPHLKIHTQKPYVTKPTISELFNSQGKGNKYWNKKVYLYADGFLSESKDETGHGAISLCFDSRKEYARWCDLCILQKAGRIKNLRRQQTIMIEEAFDYCNEHIRAITYKADHVYETIAGKIIVEDTKSFDEDTQKFIMTEAFALKWKLLKKRYPDREFKLF